MLGAITPLIGTMKPDAAKAFYGETLGLKFVSDDGFALVFEGHNTRIRISRVPAVTPPAYAVLAFEVENIERAVDALAAKGVTCARFNFLVQDARGIWNAPDGVTKVAWFYDPDMNLLSFVTGPKA